MPAIALSMALAASALSPSAIAAQASASPDLSYAFHFQRQPAPRLSIEARFAGCPEGFTVLGRCLSQWLDLPDCGHAVTAVTVRSGLSGKPLSLEHPEPNIWVFDHAPGEPLVVQYALTLAGSADGGSAYALAVNARYVSFLGDTALVVPEHLVSRPSVEIHYAWDAPLPAGWTAASSFAVSDLAKTVRLPIRAFLQSLFFSGTLYLHEASPPGKPPLRVAWLGSEPARHEREAFLSSLVTIREAVSSYVRQDLEAVTTCFVLPAAGRVSAMKLTSSLLFLADPKALGKTGEDPGTGSITAAHEFVHTTPAGQMKIVDAPVPATFFTEAFAEFIARRALYRVGLIGPKDWAEVVSGKLSKYATRLGTATSHSGAGPDEPYVLGDLLVILMDAEIRRASSGKADILSLVNAVLQRSRHENGSGQASWTDFRGALADLTSAAFVSTVEDILRLRQGLRLSGDQFAGCLRVIETPVQLFDPGFAVERSIELKQVSGVREGGPAWTAGLRDGDTLLQWSIQWGRSNIPARFVVSNQGKRRSVSYLPLASLNLGTRLEVVPAMSGTGCDKVL